MSYWFWANLLHFNLFFADCISLSSYFCLWVVIHCTFLSHYYLSCYKLCWCVCVVFCSVCPVHCLQKYLLCVHANLNFRPAGRWFVIGMWFFVSFLSVLIDAHTIFRLGTFFLGVIWVCLNSSEWYVVWVFSGVVHVLKLTFAQTRFVL